MCCLFLFAADDRMDQGDLESRAVDHVSLSKESLSFSGIVNEIYLRCGFVLVAMLIISSLSKYSWTRSK